MSATDSASAVASENWKLLRYFNFYRALIACAAAGYDLSGARILPLGESNPLLFYGTALTYAAVAFAGIAGAWRRWPRV